MEPLDDRELKSILDLWTAPDAPARLRETLFARQPWWGRFWRAQIRIPVPVAICAIVLALVASVIQTTRPPKPPVVTEVTFRELQPVKELKPRIIRRPL